MNRTHFLRALRQEARTLGFAFRIDKAAGKGSHYRVYVGDKFTTVQSGELTPLMIKTIRRQLGLK
jgi:hypothetical protein